MSLISTKEMLIKAQEEGYAVPAFNIHNLETIQVVLDAARDLKSPVILAATPSTVKYADENYLLAIIEKAKRDKQYTSYISFRPSRKCRRYKKNNL